MMAQNIFGKLFHGGNSYWLTRFAILRLLGFVYAVAFLIAAQQLVPLVGEHGLTPANHFFQRVEAHFGSRSAAALQLPSLFWFGISDQGLAIFAWIGSASRSLSLAVSRTRFSSAFSGRRTCPSFTLGKFGTAMVGRRNCSRPGSCRSFFARCSMVVRFRNAARPSS